MGTCATGQAIGAHMLAEELLDCGVLRAVKVELGQSLFYVFLLFLDDFSLRYCLFFKLFMEFSNFPATFVGKILEGCSIWGAG